MPMKQGRRIALLLTALMTAVILLAFPAAAEETGETGWKCPEEIRKDETGKWDYGVLEDGTAVITGFTIEGTTLKIPDEVDGIPVTMVARAPLDKLDYQKIRAVKKVTLPGGLKAIEQQAFEFFSAMTAINIPKGLEVIGYAAFRECKSLKNITIPDTVVSIGDEAFSKCSSLGFPKLPATLTKVGSKVFYQCGKISNVKLPASVKTVGDYAFAYCGIGKLDMEEGLEEIGEGAFLGHKLREAAFPSTLKSIGNIAFHPENNKGLQKVTFSSASTKLGTGVFGYDDGWNKVYKKIQSGETDIKKEDYDKKDPANWIDYYRDADNLGQETLAITCYPGSTADQLYQHHVTKSYLKGSADNTMTAAADRVFKAGQYTNADMVYELVIPEGVEELEDYAFAGLETLNRITLPVSLTKIGAHAFENCIGLKEVIVQGKTMTEIGEAAFAGCSELKSIVIPDGVTDIPDSVFDQCKKLETVKMPKEGVLHIGRRAFAECAALKDLKLNNGLESIGTEAFRGCGVKSLQIPDSVTAIGNRAFYLSGITSLKFPAGLEEITDSLCAYSFKLNQVTLPKALKRIGKCAFIRCPLSSLTLPEGLESIGELAFAFDAQNAMQQYGLNKYVSKLRGLKIPASVKMIEKEAFIANDAMTTITFAKDARLEEIGDNAFAYCVRLGSLAIPDSVRIIGSGAFLKCVSLRQATIGAGIETLGESAFEQCPKMTRLTFTGNPKTIGDNLIKNHSSRLTVVCPGAETEIYTYLQRSYKNIKLQVKTPKK